MRLRRVPFGRQRIDAEFAVLLGEGLFFSAVTLCLPLLACVWPKAVVQWIVFDQIVALGLAVLCAIKMRRFDILTALVSFPLLRIVNSAILLRTFWSEVIRGQQTLEWFTVSRYSHAEPTAVTAANDR